MIVRRYRIREPLAITTRDVVLISRRVVFCDITVLHAYAAICLSVCALGIIFFSLYKLLQ